jgi:predicted transcriptional regulator
MPIYDIRGPDGKIYSIEGPEGATREQVIAAIKARLAAKRPTTEQAGFLESFGESALGLTKAPEAARFALTETAAADEARKELLEAKKPKKATTSLSDITDLASAVDWAKQTAGSSAGYLVAPAVVSTVGKMLTKAPGAAKALGYGTLGAQYLIDNLTRQAAEQEGQIERGEAPSSTSLAKAGVAATGQVTLDAVGFKFFKPLFGRFPLLKNLVGESGEKAAKEAEDTLLEAARNGTLRRSSGLLTGAAKGVAFEIPQEIGQQMLERAQAGLSLSDENARHEYFEAGAGAALLGAPLGGLGRYYQNKQKLEEAQQIQLMRDIKREEDRQKQKAAEEEATTEEKKVETATKREVRKAEAAKKLDAARGILFGRTDQAGAPIVKETESGEFERELIGKGIPANTATRLIKSLEKEGVITSRDPVTGIRSLVPEAKAYDLTGEVKAEKEPEAAPAAPAVTPPTPAAPAPAAAAPAVTPPTPAAPAPAAPAVTPPTVAKTEGEKDVRTEAAPAVGAVDVGAGGAGATEPVQPRGPERPEAGTAATPRLDGADETTRRTDDGKRAVQTALNNPKLETWQARFERTASQFAADDPKSPINLLARINKLKKALSEGLGVQYTDQVEDIVSYIRRGADIETVADKLNLDEKTLSDYLEDLREAGILTADNKPVPEAFVATQTVTKDGKKGRVIPSEYDRFLSDYEAPIVQVARDLDKLIEKYDAEGVIGNTGDIRSRISANIDELESDVYESQARRVGEPKAALAKREVEAGERAQREIAADKSDEYVAYSRTGLFAALQSGNAETVLDYLAERAAANPSSLRSRFVYELVKRLKSVDFSSVKVVVETSPNADKSVFARIKKDGRFAEYDPRTNTVYLTEEGASPKNILHEFVHAATVRVLNNYLNPDTRQTLNNAQREAAEHLVKIYDFAKTRLGGRYPNAFENVYEFVAYAMASPRFQQELSRLRRPSLAKYTKMVQDLWEQFTDALSRMFGLLTEAEVRQRRTERVGRKRTKARGKALLEAGGKEAERIKKGAKDLKTKGEEILGTRLSRTLQDLEDIRRDPEGNLLLEVSEGFHQILLPPEAGIEMEPLAAKVVPATEDRDVSKIKAEYRRKLETKHPTEPPIRGAIKFLKTHEGAEWVIRKFQNDRRPLKVLQDALVATGKLIVGEENFNNLYSLISLSSGNAFHVMTQYFQNDMNNVHGAIEDYAKARGLSVMDALSDLNLYMIALHEPERRLVKFLRTVPLDNTKLIQSSNLNPELLKLIGGTSKTAAAHRRDIFNLLRTDRQFSKDDIKLLRDFVESLAGYKNGKKVGMGSIDAVNGKSLNPNVKPGKLSGDINDGAYNVAGEFTPIELERMRAAYESDPHKAIVDRMRAGLQNVEMNTREQNKKANYWSRPVDNIVNFYGFKNYVPLKGKPNSADTEDESEYNYTGKRLSGELAEILQSFEGRISDADNVIMQTLVDGAKSAMRSGRRDVTQAIRNMLEQKLIAGKILTKKPIPFADREKELDSPKYKGDDKIYHYRPDGSVEVFQITDRKMLESIRRVYREKSPFIDMANRITSGIGQSHTRYNPAFHPYNFIRDILTNAFTLGAEMGPEKSLAFLGQVSTRVAHGGMMKAAKISKMYAEGNVAGIKALAEKDPFSANILEYLEEGGRISYVQGLAIRGQIDELVRDVNRGKWVRQKEKIDKWVDIWTDMFELTSRAAAYETAKSTALARGLSERAARQEAAAYAKNLANFEQVGEWGRQAGALYMFFRPAATGAVRALDALRPLLVDVDTAVSRLPEAIRQDPAAVNRFKANYAKSQRDTQAMVLSLAGAGFTLYAMALAAADEDDLGRNKVATEDMALWTRNLRLPLGFLGVDTLKDDFLQLPWGFGLGAFAAMGSQIAGIAMGRSSVSDGLANSVTIALDSFVPLPVARFDPRDNFPAWMMDSLAPSMARPFLEYTMNVDTFGREIYNNRISKYGDAYTGGSHVPELYNRAARKLFEITNAQVDASPNTMYFFANNYIDGLSRIGHNGLGTYLWASGDKEFDPKRDLLFMDSFFGKKSSVDAREFSEVEQEILQKEKRLNALKDRPELLQRYVMSNPNDPALVHIYNQLVNRRLKQIRTEMNRVKAADYTPRERQDRLRQLELARDFTMRSIIDTFKQYGLEP